MPYRHAPYYVLFVIAVIVAGFWPSYFAASGNVPWQFHAHGVAASIWVTMVLAQSWTAHHKQFGIHAAVGKSSLLLFPFLIGGLAAIIDLTGKTVVADARSGQDDVWQSFVVGLASRSPPMWSFIIARSNIGGRCGSTPVICCRPR